MGFGETTRFIGLGVKRSKFRKFGRHPHIRWSMMKTMVDNLIKHQRMETSVARAKEVQQYVEEIVHFAKKDTPQADKIVESMLVSSQARQILYEKLLPRYRERPFFVTRIVPQWRVRMRDASPRAFIEFIDRPGELRPARPVGNRKLLWLWEAMQKTRRNHRRYFFTAKRLGLLTEEGKLIEDPKTLLKLHNFRWKHDPMDATEEGGDVLLTESDRIARPIQVPPSDLSMLDSLQPRNYPFALELNKNALRKVKEQKYFKGFIKKF
uniref:Ribosomal protein L17 n=1 Tax=Chromera velia CCMP2878 TaxID=1169474 RepID=A0A0G4F0W8_9ALVE|mmetsp:Transcript_42906/g.84630  ORF Transcript_42906/g.84630 Transcript_42906/m.84630 type:complete len:266 (+) Transcript_42906:153-950(+)|eukprot:Cvel_14649.t1-p1 / transcript=Cvel_14649.t1 / gene=Cvel_14649 / organism=Chromera_velia_CCMP2878 / gene_product=50S ribosomal protein L17, putative / transcript_product=50S ribosomal protein L17, putative / location=Cvel_scaffold1049:16298-19202(+) / protein_length=265 / sequence_SO=supercontig / SO=protein_coding / is_pseudo=false